MSKLFKKPRKNANYENFVILYIILLFLFGYVFYTCYFYNVCLAKSNLVVLPDSGRKLGRLMTYGFVMLLLFVLLCRRMSTGRWQKLRHFFLGTKKQDVLTVKQGKRRKKKNKSHYK